MWVIGEVHGLVGGRRQLGWLVGVCERVATCCEERREVVVAGGRDYLNLEATAFPVVAAMYGGAGPPRARCAVCVGVLRVSCSAAAAAAAL